MSLFPASRGLLQHLETSYRPLAIENREDINFSRTTNFALLHQMSRLELACFCSTWYIRLTLLRRCSQYPRARYQHVYEVDQAEADHDERVEPGLSKGRIAEDGQLEEQPDY